MPDFTNQLRRIVGEQNVISDKQAAAPYTTEFRQHYASDCVAVVLPRSTEQVSEIVDYCAKQNVSIVPQGGNTGLTGGSVATGDQLIVNLKRLNSIIYVDADDYAMCVQAGCVLANIRESAKQVDRLFPLSLGSQGSCQIGGNLATNAGGINVLRYGNTRDLVLGLEVVLPNGKVIHGLNKLRKNNTGYDLKNLFIGAEGTLGIITSAVLKLFPLPRDQFVSLIGLHSLESGLTLLSRLKIESNGGLSTFELMSQTAVQTAVEFIDGQTNPFNNPYPWYILAIIDSGGNDPRLKSQIENVLADCLENNLINDVLVAQNQDQAQRLISLREDIVPAQKFIGGSIKHDVSVPVSGIPSFIEDTCQAIARFMPGARCYLYGHLGDGNIHFNISQPGNMEKDEFLGSRQKMNTLVYEIVHNYHGSFSAEHGIGMAKLEELEKFKDPAELELFRMIKNLLDPKNIMNPGKVLR